MAIENYVASTGTLYLGFRDGFLISTPKGGESPDELKEFENQNGVKVTKRLHGPVIAKINDITVREGQYGKELLIWMSDGGEKYCLQLKHNSWSAIDFYKVMENIDFSEEVRILGVTNNGYSNLYVQQRLSEPVKTEYKEYKKGDWKAVRWSMDWNDIPPVEEVIFKGKKEKDNTKMLEYFAPKLKGVMDRLKTLETVDAAVEDGQADLGDVDDLPF